MALLLSPVLAFAEGPASQDCVALAMKPGSTKKEVATCLFGELPDDRLAEENEESVRAITSQRWVGELMGEREVVQRTPEQDRAFGKEALRYLGAQSSDQASSEVRRMESVQAMIDSTTDQILANPVSPPLIAAPSISPAARALPPTTCYGCDVRHSGDFGPNPYQQTLSNPNPYPVNRQLSPTCVTSPDGYGNLITSCY